MDAFAVDQARRRKKSVFTPLFTSVSAARHSLDVSEGTTQGRKGVFIFRNIGSRVAARIMWLVNAHAPDQRRNEEMVGQTGHV